MSKALGFTKISVKKDWKGKKNLIVVDVNTLARSKYIPFKESGEMFFKNQYRRYTQKPLTFEVNGEETNTSCIYGLFSIFKSYGLENDYVFCFTLPKNILSDLEKNYKNQQVSVGDDYLDQINTIYMVLKDCGFTVMAEEGYEAKDCIFKAIDDNYTEYDNIGIISANHDLATLVDDKVKYIDVLKKNTDITKENYVQTLGCPYNTLNLKKALVGDPSKKLTGVRGFGEAKFKQFLIEEDMMDCGDILFKEHEYIKNSTFLSEEQKIQALNTLRKLLPYETFVDSKVNKTEGLNKRIIRAYLKKYGMESVVEVFK